MFSDKKKRLKREAAIRKEAAEEATQATRDRISIALQGFQRDLAYQMGRSYINYVRRTRDWLNTTLIDRFSTAREAGRSRLSDAVKLTLANKQPSKLLEAHAEAHRQRIIRDSGANVERLMVTALTNRAEELIALAQSKPTNQVLQHTGLSALPAGTRFFARKPNGTSYFIIEQPPMVRTVKFSWNKRQSYRLAFPFVIFIVQVMHNGNLGTVTVFFRNERLQSLTDTLLKAALPNTYNEEYVCFYPAQIDGGVEVVGARIERALEDFWSSTFNSDGSESFRNSMAQIPSIATLEMWESNTHKNPSFALTTKWLASRDASVSAVIERLTARDDSTTPHNSSIQDDIVRISKRAATDVKAILAERIERWRIEDHTATVVSEELTKILDEGIRTVEEELATIRQDVFADFPGESATQREAGRLLSDLVDAANAQLTSIELSSLSTKNVEEGVQAA